MVVVELVESVRALRCQDVCRSLKEAGKGEECLAGCWNARCNTGRSCVLVVFRNATGHSSLTGLAGRRWWKRSEARRQQR